MSERSEKARDEFLSESQEIVEQLSRDLLSLSSRPDAAAAAGAPPPGRLSFDPELLNDAFRAVHSLKGLAGIFGVARMMQLSHHLENLLDSLRLGRIDLSAQALDLLFEAVEHYQRIIADISQSGITDEKAVPREIEDFIARVNRAASAGVLAEAPRPEAPAPSLASFDLDPMLLSVLSEYEEHRLKENIRQGRNLYRIQVSFPLLSIDVELENLKARLKPAGEVITYLPGSGGQDPDRIDLEVMLGSALPLAAVEEVAAGMQVALVPVARRAPSLPPAALLPPAPPPALPSAPPAPAPPPAEHRAPPPPVHAAAPAAETPRVSTPPAEAAHAAEPPAERPEKAEPTSLKSVAQTVRVDIRKLDHLMNIVGELALARTGIQQVQNELKLDRGMTEFARKLQDELRLFSRKLDELQAGILEVRMVPLGQVFDKLSRVVRKLSREAGKEIRFVVSGADTELDKLIVEELSDPLMHVIRNAIDHGIEMAEVRQRAGKPEAGTVAISAEQRGNHVVLEVEDDGVGIDSQGLLRRAISRGLLTSEQAQELGQHEIYNLMFLPGLSTRDKADETSGRGVGMDVVKTNIARLSGIIDVASERGQGTRLTITLPITLAIIQALVIRCAGRTYAIPLNSVMESLMLDYSEIRTIERREVISLRDQTLPLLRLEDAFLLCRPGPPPQRGYVVVVAMAQHRMGILVDDLLGQQDIVIKSLGRTLQGIAGIAGATELGGQQTALVLDVRALAEEALPRAVEAA